MTVDPPGRQANPSRSPRFRVETREEPDHDLRDRQPLDGHGVARGVRGSRTLS